MLENRIVKLESEIKELKTELSIALEFYAEVREFLNDLLNLAKTTEVKKQELDIFKPSSILESTSHTTVSKPKSKIDEELDRVVNLIFKDYRTQGQ
jgi:hypothetical protein